MKIGSCLSDIFERKKITILKYFHAFPYGKFTGLQVAKTLDLNHKTTLSILNDLEALSLIQKESFGAAHIFYRRPSWYWDTLIGPLIQQEKTMLSHLKTTIKKTFYQDCESIILFGSYARNEQKNDSDLDICFVTKNKSQVFEDKVHQFEETFYETYLCHLSAYIIPLQDFNKEQTDIIKEIKQEGDIIWSKQNQ